MTAIRSEKLESTESTEEDSNLAAVSEVEAGIRDFVRNDIAYLRRAPSMLSSGETALEPSTEATVNNVNSLIQRVAGTSLGEIENLISELESLRDLLHAEGQRVQRDRWRRPGGRRVARQHGQRMARDAALLLQRRQQGAVARELAARGEHVETGRLAGRGGQLDQLEVALVGGDDVPHRGNLPVGRREGDDLQHHVAGHGETGGAPLGALLVDQRLRLLDAAARAAREVG